MPNPVNISHLSADDWEHGFVAGNGRQGAVCYGGPDALRVTVSHERLFLPLDEPLDPPDTASVLPALRKLLSERHFQAAADEVMRVAMAGDDRYRTLRQSDPFVGAATLTFTPHRRETTGWQRSVDFSTGVVSQGQGTHRQDVFVSRVRDVVVIRISGDPAVHGTLHLGPIHGAPGVPVRLHSTATPRQLLMTASFAGGGYTVSCQVHPTGGAIHANLDGASLTIANAHEMLLIVRTTMTTSQGDPIEIPPDYRALLAEHAAVHRPLFDRCRVNLSAGSSVDGPTTEVLLAAATPELIETLFDAGRYAIISASGELPPNLQGVWSGTYEPAWRGGYTLDGNLQSALAAVAVTGTPELLLPLFDLLDTYRHDFRDNARRLYGSDGILVPPHLTTHGRHNHFTPRWCLTFWTAGAAWLARLYYDYWLYTGDREFLVDRALPFMREATAFYTSFVTDRDGVLTFAPSYSPENEPANDQPSQACVNATMDVAALRDLLTNLLAGTDAAGLTADGADIWQDMLARLPRYRVDEGGTLAEWLWPGLPDNHAHRHASHLFGLWYEPDPALLDDPLLRAAAARTVRERLAWWREQGDEMAFGLVQLGLAAACLGLAEEAYEMVCRLATRYWRPSLVSTHNAGAIFNTDICGGFPALVTSMLVSSRGDTVRVLPALPAAWPTGRIHGVLLRGGIRVERLSWSPDLVEVDLVDAGTRDLTVCVRDQAPVIVAGGRGQARTLRFQ